MVAFGPHLSPEYGRTVDGVTADGFAVDAAIESLVSSDTDVGMAKSLGLRLTELKPNILTAQMKLLQVCARAWRPGAAGRLRASRLQKRCWRPVM